MLPAKFITPSFSPAFTHYSLLSFSQSSVLFLPVQLFAQLFLVRQRLWNIQLPDVDRAQTLGVAAVSDVELVPSQHAVHRTMKRHVGQVVQQVSKLLFAVALVKMRRVHHLRVVV